MRYRRLGKTELMVSEIGLGGEWLERHSREECSEVLKTAEGYGINILDCWMCDPRVRSSIGDAIDREKWIIQGHLGSTWQNEQYTRTRDVEQVRIAFQDMLDRFHTNYIDLGMIHYVDNPSDWEGLQKNGFLDYVLELKRKGTIRHIGLSTHNPEIGILAAGSGFVEMILFALNPAFDLHASDEEIEHLFDDTGIGSAAGIAPDRAAFYKACEENDVGITVMKPFAGGRLFDAARSPFGVALTPVQCIHYALTRPMVGSVLCGYDTPEHVAEAVSYEEATDAAKDYATVLAGAPAHAWSGQCTYCGHCKPCPNNIDIALVNKYYDLAVMQDTVPALVRAHYLAISHKADECIGCRACEARCPFGVKIAERMVKARELFG